LKSKEGSDNEDNKNRVFEPSFSLKRSKMKIFITGSSGFIGQHLKDHYRDHEIKEFDIHESIFNDLRIEDAVKKVVREFQPDVVIHLAANANPGLSTKFPREDLAFNTIGTINLLEACKDVKNLKAFIFASAAQIYGEPQYFPVDEKHPLDPLYPYTISKLSAEYYIRYYTQNYGLPGIIFRFFNIYGPYQRGYVIVNIFNDIEKATDSIPMFGGREDSRDFVYIQDLCRAFDLAIEKRPVGEIMNIATGKERQQVIIRTTCTNQNGEVVIEGQGMHKILEK